MMADDYYTQWLGLAPGARPPDHYVLLALPRFVNSPHAIEAASEAQCAKLEPYRTGTDQDRAAVATAMMNDIAAALTVLKDPTERKAYDTGLARQLGFDAVPSSKGPDMAETKAGAPPLDSDRPDFANLTDHERHAADVLGQMAGDPNDVPYTLFEGQTPLQEIDPAFGARGKGVTMPVWLICALVGFGLLLVVGLTTMYVMLSGPDTTADSSQPAPPPPPPPRAFEFAEYFDASELGAAYEVRAPGKGSNFGVRDGFLCLGSADRSPVRIDVTPQQKKVLFRQVTLRARIEQGATLGVGIATAATLTVRSSKDGLTIHAVPGQPVAVAGSDDWPILPHSTDVDIELVREEGTVAWQVNGQAVATSPDITPRSWPSLVLTSRGPAGRRVAIDSLHVVYDPYDRPIK